MRQFARAWTIDEYDVTMPVSYIRVTSQINCGDIAILNQKSLSLATTAKSAIDKYNNWCKASKLIAPALTTIWSQIFKMGSWKKNSNAKLLIVLLVFY